MATRSVSVSSRIISLWNSMHDHHLEVYARLAGTDRLRVAKIGSFVQNGGIAISMMLLYALDMMTDSHSEQPWTFGSGLVFVG